MSRLKSQRKLPSDLTKSKYYTAMGKVYNDKFIQ